jgi:hypothetical protein
MGKSGPWSIDGHPEVGRFGCFRSAWVTASKLAMKTKQDVIVRFHGQKFPGNSNPMVSDLRVTPNGLKDFTIDPTWTGR